MYRGDAQTKYSKPNQPGQNNWVYSNPAEMAALCQLGNPEDAGNFMLKVVDLDPNTRTPMPDVDSVEELQRFGISADRHRAYEDMWNGLTYVGVLANAAMWLYL